MKTNKTLYHHLKILQDQQETKSRLDKLWLQYRIDKQYIAQGDYLDQVAAYKQNGKIIYSSDIDISTFEPPSGSHYWLTTVNRPNGWGEF